MADSKISALPVAATLTGAELVPVVQNGISVRSTATAVAALVNAAYIPPGVGAVTRTVSAKLNESVSVLDFGADPTGVADSKTAFLNACLALGLAGGTVTVPAGGKFFIGTSFTVPPSITIRGAFEIAGSNSTNTGYDYSKMSAIRLSSAATITLGSGSGIVGMLIYQSALSFPQNNVSNYAGTAVTIGGDDSFVLNSMILGFNLAITCTGFQRPRFEYLSLDNINGISVVNCFDVGNITNCRCWPYVTVGGTGGASSALRTGTAFLLQAADFTAPTNCGEYGYAIGFDVEASNNVTLLNCWVDMVNGIVTSSVGFKVNGSSNNFRAIGGVISWQGTGVTISTTAGTGGNNRLIEVDVFNPQNGTCVQVTSGHTTAIGCNFSAATKGIDASTSAAGIYVTGCYFDTCTTPIFIGGSGQQLSNIFDNDYKNCTATIAEQRNIQNQPAQIQFNTFGTGGAYAQQNLLARGTVVAPTTVIANDVVFSLGGLGYNGASYIATAQIRGQTTGTISGTAMPGTIIFSTTPSGSNTLTDGIGINGGGNLFPLTDNTYVCGAVGARWSITYSGQFVASTAAAAVAAGSVAIGGTTAATVGAAGAATALPANPLGYLIINVGGTQAKIPYYNT